MYYCANCATHEFVRLDLHKMDSALPVAGIDLGTCYSCICIYQRGQLLAVSPSSDYNYIASCISMMNNEIHYGASAVKESMISKSIAFKEVKCIIGRPIESITEYYTRKWPFELHGKPYPYLVTMEPYEDSVIGYAYPEYIDALFLSYLVNFASEKADMEIKDIVLTVPAFFSATQLHSTLQAARLAGLNVLRVLPEPCAAALRYCLSGITYSHVMIYDLGGGTFDVTLIENKNGDFRIMNTGGNHSLGGSDFDYLLAMYLRNEFEARGITIDLASRKFQKLVTEAERAKIALSAATSTEVSWSTFSAEEGSYTLGREKFERLIQAKIGESIETCLKCLKEVNVTLGPKDAILLVGGSSRIPLVEMILGEVFKGIRICKELNPDEVVAQGACLAAVKDYSSLNNSLPNVSVSLYTVHDYYYSLDQGGCILLFKKGTSQNTVYNLPIEVKAENKYIFLWQMVDGELLCVGWIDVSRINGRLELRVSFNSCSELVFQSNGSVVELHYYCEMPEKEKEKYQKLHALLKDIQKAMKTLEKRPDYPLADHVLTYLKQLKAKATEFIFKVDGTQYLQYFDQLHSQLLQYYRNLIE